MELEWYATVAKIARNGCDRDRSQVLMTSPMPKYLGYFGIGDVIDTRDLSLSQPFLAILATIAYIEFISVHCMGLNSTSGS